jgi:hypothetical protein
LQALSESEIAGPRYKKTRPLKKGGLLIHKAGIAVLLWSEPVLELNTNLTATLRA